MTGIVQRNRQKLFESIVPQDDDLLLQAGSKLAADLGIWLHIGSTAIRISEEKAANRAVLFSPSGGIAATYDKIHMFDVDLDNGERWRESAIYEPGKSGIVVNTDRFRLGISICYDLRFPELYRVMAVAGANLLACPAAFTQQTGKAHWHVLARARAIESGSFLLAAAQGGHHEDGRVTYGHSIIINPWGEKIAEIANDEPGFIACSINLAETDAARGKIPNLKNHRDFFVETVDAPAKGPVGEIA